MNYNNILASLLKVVIGNLESGNSNVDADQFKLITDGINRATVLPIFYDRENAIKYMDVSDAEFARLTNKGTKYHPITPLLSTSRVQGVTKPVYLRSSMDALLNAGLVHHCKKRGKYKTKNKASDEYED